MKPQSIFNESQMHEGGGAEYFAKSRFRCEAESRKRRSRLGRTGYRSTKWAISQLGELASGGVIVDLACGNGRHFEDLSKVAETLLGGDYSEAMLEAARTKIPARAAIPLLRLEAERLPFADRSLEGVFCARFLHHVPTRAIREVILAEMFRATRKVTVVTYKAKYTWEHLVFKLKRVLRSKNQRRYRYFIREAEFREIAKARGWRLTRKYSSRGFLTANRVLVFEPLNKKTYSAATPHFDGDQE